MVAGILYASLSAIFCMVPRRILPDRVFGSLPTTVAVLMLAVMPPAGAQDFAKGLAAYDSGDYAAALIKLGQEDEPAGQRGPRPF